MELLKKTLIFGIIMISIDIPWITYVMSRLYKNVFKITLNKPAAILAYLCMVLTYPFIISKFTKLDEQIKVAMVLGLVTFGTYGFTLAAIYNKYPLSTAFMETLWGVLLFTITTILTYCLTKQISLNSLSHI